jgi:hypothetical protein
MGGDGGWYGRNGKVRRGLVRCGGQVEAWTGAAWTGEVSQAGEARCVEV